MTLIATDLDGTIVDSDKHVSDRTIAALEARVTAGDTVVFLTGRSPDESLQDLPLHVLRDGRMYCANGAIEFDAVRNRVLHAREIAVEPLRRAIALCRKLFPGGHVCIDGLTRTVYDAGHEWMPAGTDPANVYDDVKDAVDERLHPYKVTYLNPSYAPDEMVRALEPELIGAVSLTYGSTKNPFFLEMVPPGVSKGNALATFAESVGIPLTDTIAFGDMPNDVEMFQVAGQSFAMGDAPASVVASATHRTGDVNEDGVAQALESVFASAVD